MCSPCPRSMGLIPQHFWKILYVYYQGDFACLYVSYRLFRSDFFPKACCMPVLILIWVGNILKEALMHIFICPPFLGALLVQHWAGSASAHAQPSGSESATGDFPPKSCEKEQRQLIVGKSFCPACFPWLPTALASLLDTEKGGEKDEAKGPCLLCLTLPEAYARKFSLQSLHLASFPQQHGCKFGKAAVFWDNSSNGYYFNKLFF